MQVSSDEVKKALHIFPPGSSSGSDGLTMPQHLKDLLAGASDDNFLNPITQLINFMLSGSFPSDINTIVFGGRLIALLKKDGVRPMAI